MSKIKDYTIQEEAKRQREIEREADARYQTLMEELNSFGLSREEMIAHEEELALIKENND